MKSRVAKKRVLQLVLGYVVFRISWIVWVVDISVHKIILSLSLCLSDGDIRAVYGCEEIPYESVVYQLVAVLIYGARCSKESYGTAFLAQYGGLTDIVGLTVKRHDVARGSNPQRQILVGKVLKVAQSDNHLVRQLVGTAVSAIVHQKGSCLLLLHDGFGYFRIGGAC